MKLQSWDPDLRSLVNRIDQNEIDLQPDFQRQEVWTAQKQKRLIDTILRDWSIPPVHFVESQEGILEVLDGQQRLAAVRDFVHGRFSVDGAVPPEDSAVVALHGKFYDGLPPLVKRRFDNYTIRAFKITDYNPEEPSELFYRLNQPTTLTAGEQRNSLYGVARRQLKTLVSVLQETNSRDTIGFSNARLAYDDVVARHLFFLEKKRFDFKATETSISDFFRRGAGFSAETIERVRAAIIQFSQARERAGKVRLNKASLLSWFLFYSRGPSSEKKRSFLGQFSGTIKHNRNLVASIEASKLFQDRASGRVTDVSSVVIRDFCLWLSHTVINEEAPSDDALRAQLEIVLNEMEAPEVLPLEQILESRLNFRTWSALA